MLRAQVCLASADFFRLLCCRMAPFVREAVFSEVSGFMVIKEIHQIQSVPTLQKTLQSSFFNLTLTLIC